MPLELMGITKSFGGERVLDGLSFTFPEEGAICVSGPSGCGKTTLLHIILGLVRPDSGAVSGLEGKKISAVFQEDRLLPWATVKKNVELAAPGGSGRERLADGYLEKLGIAHARGRLPEELSGGMARRAAIARALVYGGDVFLLDEPFKGIDDEMKKTVISLLKDELRGKLTVFAAHDREEIKSFADRELKIIKN